MTQEVGLARGRVAARTAGHRVEAVSERSETATTWVNPDGTLTTEVSAGPIRFSDQQAKAWRDGGPAGQPPNRAPSGEEAESTSALP
ncbi:hypothetical protein WKI68_17375 [Streptomyces sp. MS1.HAVA.3]|uniref:Uncharacterized protein n=1 Tax=Streptomyces caledonius TaxID=3134107 RepID=A0ABU8U473_9ACTN